MVIGRIPLVAERPFFLSLQRIATDIAAAEELSTYREVSADRAGINRAPAKLALAPVFAVADLPRLFGETEQHFDALRQRVKVETPDPFLNAAVGALNVAADAVWDAPKMRSCTGPLRGGPSCSAGAVPICSMRSAGTTGRELISIIGRAVRTPIRFQATFPLQTETNNLARNEAGLHSNGDLSNSHYDMNLVYIDALFRHLRWTGDVEFAKKMWPVIERHLAWERRLFRREFGPEKLPLYEAYAVIWASDDLQYSGGGAAHASAYNYWHNKMAAQIAPLVGADPKPFAREAELIARGMRELLWMPERGMFAESKDWLGLQEFIPARVSGRFITRWIRKCRRQPRRRR